MFIYPHIAVFASRNFFLLLPIKEIITPIPFSGLQWRQTTEGHWAHIVHKHYEQGRGGGTGPSTIFESLTFGQYSHKIRRASVACLAFSGIDSGFGQNLAKNERSPYAPSTTCTLGLQYAMSISSIQSHAAFSLVAYAAPPPPRVTPCTASVDMKYRLYAVKVRRHTP